MYVLPHPENPDSFGAGVAALAAGAGTSDERAPRSGHRRAGRRGGSGGRLVGAPLGLASNAADLALRPQAMICGPHRGGHDLAVVGALAADPWRGQHPAQALRRPRSALRLPVSRGCSGRRRSSAPVRRPAAAARTRDHGRLRRPHGHFVVLVAVRAQSRHPRRRPRWAISTCLRKIRSLLWSLSYRAMPPSIRAVKRPT